MKQAGMFAFMMAKKVGVDMNKPNSIEQEIGQSNKLVGNTKSINYKGKQIEIEVDQDKAA